MNDMPLPFKFAFYSIAFIVTMFIAFIIKSITMDLPNQLGKDEASRVFQSHNVQVYVFIYEGDKYLTTSKGGILKLEDE